MFYGNQYQAPQIMPFSAQKMTVPKVSGQPGAMAFQMPPGSSILLLDETAPVVFLASTDDAGYKTVTAYDIKPHTPAEPVDVSALERRIEKLEEALNGKSYLAADDRNKGTGEH